MPHYATNSEAVLSAKHQTFYTAIAQPNFSAHRTAFRTAHPAAIALP